jgi:signal peptidase I
MIEKIQILAYRRFVFIIFRFFFLFLLGIFIIRFFIFSSGAVNGPSMEPTFIDEDMFFVNRIEYLFHSPKRFDVVQFIEPQAKRLILKRVIGLPGETIVIRHGKVFLRRSGSTEENEINESEYLSDSVFTALAPRSIDTVFSVPENSYFLLGDNRPRSIDSRHFGSVHRDQIIGHIYSL